MKQKPVVRFVDEDLTRSLAVVERFGIVGVGRREDDEAVIVASVTYTAASVLAIGIVERVAADESVAAFVVFRIRMVRKCAGLIDRNSLKSIFLVESSSAN